MEALNIILYPLVKILSIVFKFILYFFSDFPIISVLLFATSISLLLKPIQRPLRKIEKKTSDTINLIEKEYSDLSVGMNNEDAFLLRESLYKKYSFSPFESYKQAISFFVLIPFLVSVIIIFQDSSFVNNSFIFGIPLNKPDGLLFGFNLFPVLMFISTYLDSSFRYANDKKSKYKFLLISVILFFLVYNLPSVLIIFWISMNFINMIFFYSNDENK